MAFILGNTNSSLTLFFLLMISYWALLGHSQQVDSSLFGLGSLNLGPLESMPCIQTLIPCQPYLTSPAPAGNSPAPECCVPLTGMIGGDPQCLCSLVNNDQLLKSLNINRDQALGLPKACGVKTDISVCNQNASGPVGSPISPSTSPSITNNTSGTVGLQDSTSISQQQLQLPTGSLSTLLSPTNSSLNASEDGSSSTTHSSSGCGMSNEFSVISLLMAVVSLAFHVY